MNQAGLSDSSFILHPSSFKKQWHGVFGRLADHSGGPATDSHRLPFSPRGRGRGPGGPVETEGYR
jgi:hypothetical protein